VYLMVRSIADLHTAFGGGSAVDYLAIASAGRVVHGGSACVYCPGALAAAQAQLLGYTPAASGTFPIPFVNPALMAWLIQPLALLPLQTGTDIFVTLNIVAMALAAAMLARRAAPRLGAPLAASLVVIAVFSTGILLGQSDGLMLLAATLAIEALTRGRPVIAGLLLVPLLLKPQLVWLVPPALVVARQWRMLAALAAGAVVVLVGSVAVAGPAHLMDAVGLVTAPAYAHLDLQGNSIPALAARPLASNAAAWAAALTLAAVAVLAMVVLRDTLRRNVVPSVAIAIGLSVVLSPHLGDYSLMLLAVPVAVLAPRAPGVTVALVAAYTAASLFNPLTSLNESTVAVVLVAGLVAVVWRATHAGSGGVAMQLGGRSAAGVGNA
jgi:alpha-1,2-mannosyltransferase